MLDKRAAVPAPGANIGILPPRNQAGRPTLVELERRKALVMEVATQLFVEQGFAETSLVDIAKRAGVATRTLYQHFGDKEAIFREVVFARRAGSLIPKSSPEEGMSLFDALVREAQDLMTYVLDERSVDLMRLMVTESRRFPDLMKKVANATFARVMKNITHVFEVLAERGQIPDDDHATTANLFVDLMLGNRPLLVYTNWQATQPTDAEIERKIDLFILGRFGKKVGRTARSKPAKRRAAKR